MKTEIICCGFGGQGVLTTGKILASICAEAGSNVSWMPSYGSEMRGGTANCHITISDGEIYNPYVKSPDVLIALNSASLDKFEHSVKTGGYIFVNSSIVSSERKCRSDVQVLFVPMTEIATDLGNPRGSNLTMLGAVVSKTKLFNQAAFGKGIENFFKGKGKSNPKNAVCYQAGCDYVNNKS